MESLLFSEAVVTEVIQQGIWAILYVSLFVYTLRESKRQQEISKSREDELRREYKEFREEGYSREQKLMKFINDTTAQYERIATGVERLSLDVDEIKDELFIRRERRKAEEEWKRKNNEK